MSEKIKEEFKNITFLGYSEEELTVMINFYKENTYDKLVHEICKLRLINVISLRSKSHKG